MSRSRITSTYGHGPLLFWTFLLPALNSCRYGEKLRWLDKSNGIFVITYQHRNAHAWTEECIEVFKDWDGMKGRFQSNSKSYYTRARQRFKAAMGKCPDIQKIPNRSSKNEELYRIVSTSERLPRRNLHRQPMASQDNSVPPGCRLSRPFSSRSPQPNQRIRTELTSSSTTLWETQFSFSDAEVSSSSDGLTDAQMFEYLNEWIKNTHLCENLYQYSEVSPNTSSEEGTFYSNLDRTWLSDHENVNEAGPLLVEADSTTHFFAYT